MRIEGLQVNRSKTQAFSRMDQSFLGAWWWTVDRTLLFSILSLMLFGVALIASASPSVALRIGVGEYHFLKKHLVFLVPSIFLVFSLSMISPRYIWRLASVMFLGSIVMMLGVLIFGVEVKGAKRWIAIAGFSLQPSEFIKPAFAVVAAWLIALQKRSLEKVGHVQIQGELDKPVSIFYGYHVAVALYVFIIILLLMQPDLGMTVVLTMVFAVQIFLAGLRFRYLAILGSIGAGGLVLAYFGFSHVRSRIDRFFNPDSGDNYQVEQSLDAIRQGGLIGVGPGQGEVKNSIPDVHADFIFSVLVEEMGFAFALIVLGLFMYIILRGFSRLRETQDVFSVLAVGGLLAMFGFQSMIHIGSSVNILPAKGMTLPFVSYGGSSMLAMSFSMGMVLALTRQKKRASIARSTLTMKRSEQAN